MLGKVSFHLRIHAGIAGLPGVKAIYITVVHTECRSDKHCIVNFNIGSAFAPRPLPIFYSDKLAIALHLTCNCEQRFQLRRDRRALEVGFHAAHHVVSGHMTGCGRAMAGLAKIAVVLQRNIRGNQFALARRETAGLVQQQMRQFAHGLTVSGRKANAPLIPGRSSGSAICAIILPQRSTGSAGR